MAERPRPPREPNAPADKRRSRTTDGRPAFFNFRLVTGPRRDLINNPAGPEFPSRFDYAPVVCYCSRPCAFCRRGTYGGSLNRNDDSRSSRRPVVVVVATVREQSSQSSPSFRTKSEAIDRRP